MLDGLEPFGRPSADALRRRVGRHEIGMRLLQRPQLAQERVEFRVGDLRIGLNVVELFVTPDQLTKLANAFGGRHTRVGHS